MRRCTTRYDSTYTTYFCIFIDVAYRRATAEIVTADNKKKKKPRLNSDRRKSGNRHAENENPLFDVLSFKRLSNMVIIVLSRVWIRPVRKARRRPITCVIRVSYPISFYTGAQYTFHIPVVSFRYTYLFLNTAGAYFLPPLYQD